MTTHEQDPQQGSDSTSGLICIKAKALRRQTQRMLYSAGIRPVVEVSMDECVQSNKTQGHPFLLCYVDSLETGENDDSWLEKLVGEYERNYVAFLLESPDRNILARLLSSSKVANIVSPSYSSDLFVSLRKIRSGDIFGLSKYLAWGAVESQFLMRSSDEKGKVIAALEVFLEGLNSDHHLTNSACTVADEFITNAFYNAPIAADGSRPYRDRERTERVELPGEHAVQFSFASDGQRLAIACRDAFGSITNEQILDQLSRSFGNEKAEVSQGTGGAGVGLYLIYNYVANLVVNIEPGKASEFIGIFDLKTSKKEQRNMARGLNVFFSPKPE